MINIEARPSGLDYEDWSRRAKIARQRLVQAWIAECQAAEREDRPLNWKPVFDGALYRGFRQVFLFKAFHGKCAYCEIRHTDGYPIQVEHYRPKAGVTENRETIQHSGYFWLAYEWWNLLPSCAHCNTGHTDPLGTAHPGKKNEFPVRGARAATPSTDPEKWCTELDDESALLLNPYFDRPEDSVDFDPMTGIAIPKSFSPCGKATIEICDLNRQSLLESRRRLKEDALFTMLKRLVFDKEDLNSIVTNESELSLWRRRIVQDYMRNILERTHLTGQ